MKLAIRGIQCDFCNYKDATVEFEDYPKWLNKPCPHCSQNLLTQEDYDLAIKLSKMYDMTSMEDLEDSPHTVIKYKANGSGKLFLDKVEVNL